MGERYSQILGRGLSEGRARNAPGRENSKAGGRWKTSMGMEQ
jgi:hypothetical protein